MRTLINVSLPGAGCVYYILSLEFPEIFPYGTQALFAVAALTFFLGFIISLRDVVSDKEDGVLQIDTSDEEKDIYRLVYNEDPETLKDRKQVIFKIEHTKLD